MDAERAETFLRLLAEAKLRQAQATPAPGRELAIGLERAADALTAVGAIDAQLAGAIVAEFRQALDARSEPRLSSPASRRGRRVAGGTPLALFPGLQRPTPTAGHASDAIAEEPSMRVTPIGRAISFGDDGRNGIYLAALVVTPDSSSITVGSWTTDPGGDVRDPMLFQGLAATDDKGTAYKCAYNGAGTPELQGGRLELDPMPPPDIQWLDITPGPGQPAVRISLAPPPSAQAMTEPASATLAGLLLHRAANRLLTYWEPDTKIVRSQVAGLGDTVAALQAAGALRAEDPMPGQLATLCERLGVTGHGIAATPRPDLPETWRSVLTHHLSQAPGDGGDSRSASATFAATLPELDGVRYAVAGLHTGYDQTWLHVLADGRPAGGIAASWWLKDDAGQWHVAVVFVGDESYLQMCVIPPVDPATTTLELVVEGQTTRIRAHLPITWWSPS
jgi:hypothetical protein